MGQLFFNLYVNDIGIHVHTQIKLIQYADDCLLLKARKNMASA